MPERPIRVLFLCTGNSARSQMAEALLGSLGGARFSPYSAGIEPKAIAPLTFAVLSEIGLDWPGTRSKSADEFAGQSFDYVITLCETSRQSCPVFPGRHHALHWDIVDPAAAPPARQLAAFRAVRDELSARIGIFARQAQIAD